jgi:hypothetical protein
MIFRREDGFEYIYHAKNMEFEGAKQFSEFHLFSICFIQLSGME